MNIYNRLQYLKKLAQTATTPATTGTTTTTPTPAVANVDVRALPNFNAQLFAARPDVIVDINQIVNIINAALNTLSNGNLTFLKVWNNPSITSDASTGSSKNLVIVIRWLYTVLRSSAQQYSIGGLRQIGLSLIQMVNSYSWPESGADKYQTQLRTAGQTLVSKLGNGQQ